MSTGALVSVLIFHPRVNVAIHWQSDYAYGINFFPNPISGLMSSVSCLENITDQFAKVSNFCFSLKQPLLVCKLSTSRSVHNFIIPCSRYKSPSLGRHEVKDFYEIMSGQQRTFLFLRFWQLCVHYGTLNMTEMTQRILYLQKCFEVNNFMKFCCGKFSVFWQFPWKLGN